MGRFDERATAPARGAKDILRWKVVDTLAGRRRGRGGRFEPPIRANDGELLRSLEPSLTWIGHATLVLRLGKKLIATDPIWSKRIGGAIPRLAPPGVPFEKMPAIDLVTISHAHFDHLDMPTLKRIGPNATYLVPLGCKALLESEGLTKTIELDWWQTHREGDLEVTFVPSRHWSMRAPWTRNDTLWGGWVMRSPKGAAYHAGDTALFDGFREIGRRAGPIDWAMLPIGAYDPRWFMEPQHVSPEEAGAAFEMLGAKTLVAMHWATFKLTDEPLAEPPERLRTWWAERGLDPGRLWILDIGETRALKRAF
jgi:L-ascorbate metabolism protein UlaG (beta-lactamase superfamily)